MNRNMAGALLMMASMFAFTVNDTLLKMTQGQVPLAQLLAVRGILASVLIIPFALWFKGLKLNLSVQDWFWVSVRSVTEIGAAYCFLTALLNMPLANVSAVLQALPLTVTLGAFLLFRDPIGWRRMSAILVGFVGILLILRPGADGFSVYAIYAMGAVGCVTARDLVTRCLSDDVPSLTITVGNTVTVMVWFGVVSLQQPWVPISGDLWALIAGSAFFILGGYFFSIQTMRVGEVSFIAPFRYTSLLWALVLGWFVFGDWPDAVTMLGAGIVVATGLFTFWRNSRTSDV